MPAGYLTVRVYYDHDSATWFCASASGAIPARPLEAAALAGAEAEAAALLAPAGLSLISAWTYTGSDETGATAVFSQSGSGDATKGLLLAFWTAHKTLLGKLGVSVAALPAAQKALLFSQDVMLVGLAKTLVDQEVLTADDLTAACGAVGAADFSWLTGL